MLYPVRPRFFAALVVAILLLVLLAPCAIAAPLTATWTNPTTNTDGSAIPASGAGSVSSIRVEWGTCVNGAFGERIGDVIKMRATTLPTTHTVDLPPGSYAVRVFARNTYTEESAASNVICRTLSAPIPNPPTLVSTSAAVYDVMPEWNTLTYNVGMRVGTAPLGQECDPARHVKDDWYALKSKRAVKFNSREARSPVLAVRCQQG
jgi:hypothetical protein